MSKTGRRVLVIAVAGAVAVAGLGGAYVYRQRRLDREATEAAAAARTAYERADYQAALEGMGRYLQRFQGRNATAADYLLMARARRNVETPNGSHLIEATSLLRRSIAMDPSNGPARAELRDLYLRTGYVTEALELIETMLAANPDDVDTLRAKFDVLSAMRQFGKARDVGKEINRRAPGDLEGYFRTLEMMVASEVPSQEIDAWTDAALAAHPKDGRFELLRVASLSSRRDPESGEKARVCLDRVLAATDATSGGDAVFVGLLLAQLDRAGRFDDSLRALERIDATASFKLKRELLLRRYYSGRFADLLGQLDAMPPATVKDDPELTALRIAALLVMGRPNDAEPLRRELDERTDNKSRGWSAFIDHGASGAKVDRRKSAAALRVAIKENPGSALLRLSLGSVNSLLGEPDLAIQSWREAGERAPSWALPLRLVADALLRTPGNETLALAAARQAYVRAPRDPETVATLIQAVVRDSSSLDPRARQSLLDAIDQVRRAAPGATQDLVSYQVAIVAITDKDEGARRIRAEIATTPPHPESVLLQLARTANNSGLGLEAEILAACEAAHGATPALALAKASAVARAGDVDGGLALIDAMRGRAAPGTDPLDWGVVRAGYLQAAGRAEAGRAWIELADGNDAAIRAQLGALACDAVWTDRDAVDRIVQRVRSITGDEGTSWRVAHARWILTAPGAAVPQIAEAAQILTAVCQTTPTAVEPRVLLAQALERLDNLPGAEEQLQVASELTHDNSWISLELARVAQMQGHSDAVRRHLDRALGSNDLEPALTAKAAYLLAMQGELGRGANLLEPVAAKQAADRNGVLLLAQLYAKLGNAERALALCQRILEQPDAPTIQLAAAIYAYMGKPTEAELLLARLDQLTLPAGDRELIRALHASRWEAPDRAREWFRAATTAAPGRADLWAARLEFAIDTGEAAGVVAVLDDPAAAQAEPVRFLGQHRAEVVPAVSQPDLRGLVKDAIDPAHARDAILEALRVVSTQWQDPATRGAAAKTIRELAERNAKTLSLQLLAADRCAQVGDLRGGTDIARRAMSEFPESIEAAWQASQLLAASDRWADALEAGLAWRARSPHDNMLSEVFVARALMRTGRTPDAAASLELRISSAMTNPDANQELILTYVVALVRTDRETRAADILTGLVRGSARWRTVPLSVPPSLLGDAEHAASWLRLCARNVGEGDAAARLELARAWGAAWETFRAPMLLEGAQSILAQIVTLPGAAAEAHLVAATLAQQAGQADVAQREYAAALEADPRLWPARNNLAMLLADRGEWEKAVDEATKATLGSPGTPGFHDTLAYALRKGGQFAKANESLRTAIRLDPANPAWLLSLAESLAASPGISDAGELARVVAQVDELAARGIQLSPEFKGRLDRVRGAKR